MVKTQPSNAGVVDSIPGQGTEISNAARCGQKLKINKSLKKKKEQCFLGRPVTADLYAEPAWPAVTLVTSAECPLL